MLGIVITVGDLQSCFRDVRPLQKVTETRIYLLLLTYILHVCEACVYRMKNKYVSVTIILPFVFIASRFCNVLSISFHLRHYAPSLDSSPNSAPRWLMVWLLMFPLIVGITHRGIILTVLIFIISLACSLLFPFSFCLSQSPLTHRSPSPTQTPICAALVPVLCTP